MRLGSRRQRGAILANHRGGCPLHPVLDHQIAVTRPWLGLHDQRIGLGFPPDQSVRTRRCCLWRLFISHDVYRVAPRLQAELGCSIV